MPSESGDRPYLLAAEGLGKGYGSGTARVQVFQNVEVEISNGELLAIVGPSGCGKSTLLHLFAGLDTPDEGRVVVEGKDWSALNPTRRAELRGELVGFVFQFHHLLPELTAEENVALPLLIVGQREASARASAREALSRVGLIGKASSLPRTLSGGERQRVAIARAVIRRPRLLLCDEPTGSLDAAHAADVFELLCEVARERAGAAVIVTHDPEWARRCGTIKTLTPGGLKPVTDS